MKKILFGIGVCLLFLGFISPLIIKSKYSSSIDFFIWFLGFVCFFPKEYSDFKESNSKVMLRARYSFL